MSGKNVLWGAVLLASVLSLAGVLVWAAWHKAVGKPVLTSQDQIRARVEIPEVNLLSRSSNFVIENADKSGWKELLREMGLPDSSGCLLFTGAYFDCAELREIEIEYSEEPQPHLIQTEGPGGKVFASVDGRLVSGKLTLVIHVDPVKLAESPDRDKHWWITHQVIRALNVIMNPGLGSAQLQERDKTIYSNYSSVPLLTVVEK